MMNRSMSIWLLACAVAGAGIAMTATAALSAPATAPAAAASTAPATAPVTRPATAPSDLATPKGALRTLNLALRDGDVAAVEHVLLAEDDLQRRMSVSMAEFAAALATLHRSAAETFGPGSAKTVVGDLESESADALAAIDAADVTFDGETAVVAYRLPRGSPDKAKAPAVTLRRVGTEWRLPVLQLEQGVEATAVEEHLTRLGLLTREASRMAAEVTAGKYKDADKAAIAWRTRLMDAVVPRPSTTQATKPS